MSKLTARFTHLSKRARVLLAVVAALVVVALVGGALLAGNSSLLARLTGRLAGWAINGCEIEPNTQCPGANLRGVQLHNAHLWGANLRGADLTGANIGNEAKDTSLAGADLSGARLDEAYMRGTGLGKANLSNASLIHAILDETDLTGANLTGANLTRAHLFDAYLSDANLTNANLTDAWLLRANLTKANLTGANLTGARLDDAIWFRTTLADGSTLAYVNTDAIRSDPPPGTLEQAYQLRPRHVENRCLSGSTLFYTRIWECSNRADDTNQLWKFEPAGNFYTVKIQTSQWCLTVENASKDAGATVVASACQDTDNQLWRLDATGDGGYRLINRNSGLCAAPRDGGTTNDTVTVQYPCTSAAARLWGLHGQ
jgi:uncharacterized protein YjbI with pentapeptide repeats